MIPATAMECHPWPLEGEICAADNFDALNEQTVTVSGTKAMSIAPPRLATQLVGLRQQRTDIAAEIKRTSKRILFTRS